MRKISADLVFPIVSPPVEHAVVVVDDDGRILSVDPRDRHDPATLEIYCGALTPGFVNTHCHLELSHMKGKVATGTSLIPFITSVVRNRAAAAEIIQDAIEQAEAEMIAGGIVAVGDISNTTDTFAQKARGRLRYYTFIEMFDFLQEKNAETAFAQYDAVFQQAPVGHGSFKSRCPHAPYSVSKNLFARINDANPVNDATVSIHNQETLPEMDLFLQKSGGFINFYQGFGISLSAFESMGTSSIHYALANMNPRLRTLFVHNTLTSAADLAAAHAWSDRVYWSTCPNANLYIENRLPNYQLFIDAGARLTIGTDSLTSNWSLSVLDEMKTIQKYQSYVPFETVLRWATLNGAEALGMDGDLGSIEKGKTPGLNLVQLDSSGRLTEHSTIQKIV